MKKFFTLFALLSVGLSAWAQTYTFMLRADGWLDQYSCKINKGEPIRKLFYLKDGVDYYEFQVWEDGNDEEWVACERFWSNQEMAGYNDEEWFSPGWYDLTFTYAGEHNLSHAFNDGAVDSRYNTTLIFLSDDVSFGTYPSGAYPLEINYIEYTRSCNNEWGTLCLPFAFEPFIDDQFKDVTYYELKSATDEALVFSPIDASTSWVNAGTPLVFKLNNSSSNLRVRAWYISTLNSQASTGDVINGWKLNGTVEGTTIDAGNWVMQEDKIRKVAENGFPIKPYRAWFESSDPNSAPLRIEVDDTEGLQFVEQEDGTVKVSYDLQGRKLDDARKGLMIENGKVIMVK